MIKGQKLNSDKDDSSPPGKAVAAAPHLDVFLIGARVANPPRDAAALQSILRRQAGQLFSNHAGIFVPPVLYLMGEKTYFEFRVLTCIHSGIGFRMVTWFCGA
jgi:hypothetical protein